MHDKLQRFHRYALSRLVFILSITIGAVLAFLWNLTPDNVFTKLLAPFTSAVVVGGIFLFSEKLVRQKLWKIAYPELDFQGTWKGHTEYCTQQATLEDLNQDFTPFKKHHDIRFKQDCLSIMVDYDQTEAFHGWNSTVATIFSEGGKMGLRYAYEVKYEQGENRDKRLPSLSTGFEEISVVNSEEGARPTKVTGIFSHSCDGVRPIYSGTVVFERSINEPKKSSLNRAIYGLVQFWLKPPAE